MKFNLSFDLALFTTISVIYLFVCGYFYYDGITSFYGFSNQTLGIAYQEYLMYGWLTSIKGVFIGLTILFFISIIQSTNNKRNYENLAKFILTFIVFIGTILFKLILLFIYPIIFIFKKFFYFLIKNNYSKPMLAFIGINIIKLKNTLFNSIRPFLIESIVTTEKIIKIDLSKEDEKTFVTDLFKNYFYLIVFYFVFLAFHYYVISVGTDSKKAAEKLFNSTEYSKIILNDEQIDSWLDSKKLKLDKPLNAKIVICGSIKCLIAIPTSNIKNQNGTTMPTNVNYYIKLINADSYILIK